MRRLEAGGLLIAVILGLRPTGGPALAADTAVGTEVLLKGNAILKAGRIVVDPQKDRRLYKVERNSGPWVWVASDTMSGWVKADDIIPLASAADYYTDQIRKDPKAAWAYNMRGLIRSDQG